MDMKLNQISLKTVKKYLMFVKYKVFTPNLIPSK